MFSVYILSTSIIFLSLVWLSSRSLPSPHCQVHLTPMLNDLLFKKKWSLGKLILYVGWCFWYVQFIYLCFFVVISVDGPLRMEIPYSVSAALNSLLNWIWPVQGVSSVSLLYLLWSLFSASRCLWVPLCESRFRVRCLLSLLFSQF